MKSIASKRPADYVRPPLGQARIERMWNAIEKGDGHARVSFRARTFVGLAAAALVLVAALSALIGNALGRRTRLEAKRDDVEEPKSKTGATIVVVPSIGASATSMPVAPPSTISAQTIVVAPSPRPSSIASPDAAALFALGDEARLSGKNAEAAIYFDRLRTQFRKDARAGLAAYQLGRIRLGSLHDADGAVEAFADALSLAKNAPFHDDAELGHLEALDESGQLGACRAARIAFVTAHPTSPLLPRATKRCP